jgi:hypothetical protein
MIQYTGIHAVERVKPTDLGYLRNGTTDPMPMERDQIGSPVSESLKCKDVHNYSRKLPWRMMKRAT